MRSVDEDLAPRASRRGHEGARGRGVSPLAEFCLHVMAYLHIDIFEFEMCFNLEIVV